MVRNLHSHSQKLAVSRFLRGEELRAFRRDHHISASALAKQLVKDSSRGTTFSRAYVKRVESGGLHASPRFVKAFDELRGTLAGQPVQEQHTVTAILHHPLPQEIQEIEILARPRRCKGCLAWFIPLTPNQKTHSTAACRRAARRRKRTRRKG